MIKKEILENNSTYIGQAPVSSSVYLDHWALRTISEDSIRRDKFVDILKKNNGTLMLSLFNLFEFTKVTDRTQVRSAELLIELLYFLLK